MGDEALRLLCAREVGLPPLSLPLPLICTCRTLSPKSSTFEGISDVGDRDGVLQVGVVIIWLIELDLEEYLLCLVSNSLLESLLVISQPACRVRGRWWGGGGRRLEMATGSFVIYGRDSRLKYPVIWLGLCLG